MEMMQSTQGSASDWHNLGSLSNGLVVLITQLFHARSMNNNKTYTIQNSILNEGASVVGIIW